MSTDTAFALGMLALVGPRFPDRLRAYLLTFAVVDDLVALGIIAFAYSGHIKVPALLIGLVILGVVFVIRRAGLRNGLLYGLLGVAALLAGLVAYQLFAPKPTSAPAKSYSDNFSFKRREAWTH